MSQTLVQLIANSSVAEADIANDAVTRDKINVVSTSSAPGIEIKGDGGSQEGYLQLNCRVNSHGVKIQSPAHSSSQSYKIILPDNQIAADKVLKVKSITGSGSTAVGQLEFGDAAAGITMADKWHLTSNYNISNANVYYQIDSGWQKGTAAGYNTGSIGSAMTESSGLFTFPSTGIYYIVYDCLTGTSNDQVNMWSYISVGTNASATTYLSVKASSGDAGTMNTVTGSALLDVTDVSQQKIHVREYAANTGCYVSGNSDGQRTCITFIRLGDT